MACYTQHLNYNIFVFLRKEKKTIEIKVQTKNTIIKTPSACSDELISAKQQIDSFFPFTNNNRELVCSFIQIQRLA